MQGHYTPSGVRMSYQVSFVCFRLSSSFFFPSVTSSFLLVVLHFLFTHVSIPSITKQAAQRRQLQTNNRRAHTHAPTLQLVCKPHEWRRRAENGRGEVTKTAAVASFGKVSRQRKLERERGGARPSISTFLFFFSI